MNSVTGKIVVPPLKLMPPGQQRIIKAQCALAFALGLLAPLAHFLLWGIR